MVGRLMTNTQRLSAAVKSYMRTHPPRRYCRCNVCKDLKKCLAAVRAEQPCGTIEIVVVDGQREFVAQWKDKPVDGVYNGDLYCTKVSPIEDSSDGN